MDWSTNATQPPVIGVSRHPKRPQTFWRRSESSFRHCYFSWTGPGFDPSNLLPKQSLGHPDHVEFVLANNAPHEDVPVNRRKPPRKWLPLPFAQFAIMNAWSVKAAKPVEKSMKRQDPNAKLPTAVPTSRSQVLLKTAGEVDMTQLMDRIQQHVNKGQ